MNNVNMENSVRIALTKTTPEAIDLLQLRLIAGTTLPDRRAGDTITSIIINRKTVEYLETTPEEIIGKRLPAQFKQQMYVCGVVEDFHFKSLHESVSPYGLHNWDNQGFGDLLLKVKEGNLSQQLLAYEEIFKRHFPNDLFEVKYPDLVQASAYEEDRQTGLVVMSFSILAILVACMGVFGLSAFMAEQRTKEIGIRKVLGASVGSIVRLFTDNYLRLLALSLIIALPIAWWIGGKYLENFAYRISLAWWIFAGAALIVIVLTLCTVGYQAIKAAMANPVKSIKSE
jgi:putative ABC transport system permease protein